MSQIAIGHHRNASAWTPPAHKATRRRPRPHAHPAAGPTGRTPAHNRTKGPPPSNMGTKDVLPKHIVDAHMYDAIYASMEHSLQEAQFEKPSTRRAR